MSPIGILGMPISGAPSISIVIAAVPTTPANSPRPRFSLAIVPPGSVLSWCQASAANPAVPGKVPSARSGTIRPARSFAAGRHSVGTAFVFAGGGRGVSLHRHGADHPAGEIGRVNGAEVPEGPRAGKGPAVGP